MTCRHAETCDECATLATDLFEQVDHWRARYVAMLAAAKASIAATVADAPRDRLVPPVADVGPPGVCPDVQPDLRAAERRPQP